ncbi:hypothetical protein KSP40_PGU007293 [Platanthera guangdongensis]|uniref:Uncharacterized protein n=1 Tax=Platanthera guangdongensis TaxID=2320717 RepID=A0ABR2LGT1_9ASPA
MCRCDRVTCRYRVKPGPRFPNGHRIKKFRLPLTPASPDRICLLLQQKMDFRSHLTLLLDAATSEGKFLPFTSLVPPSSSDPSSKRGTNLGIKWLWDFVYYFLPFYVSFFEEWRKICSLAGCLHREEVNKEVSRNPTGLYVFELQLGFRFHKRNAEILSFFRKTLATLAVPAACRHRCPRRFRLLRAATAELHSACPMAALFLLCPVLLPRAANGDFAARRFSRFRTVVGSLRSTLPLIFCRLSSQRHESSVF